MATTALKLLEEVSVVPNWQPLLFCAALGLTASVAWGQDDPDLRWRRDVDRLFDRWSDDVEGDRLRQARAILAKRVKETDDPEARLELARVKLALPELRLRDRAKAARLLGEQYREARALADRAATQLAVRDGDGKLLDGGGQRYQTALALALVATQRGFQESLRAERMSGAKAEQLRPLIAAQAEEVAKRRRQLEESAGEAAGALVRGVVRRVETLTQLERLGKRAIPIGLKDVSGESVDLSAYRGKALLVLFWATEFPACKEVIEQIKGLEAKLRERKLAVIAINLDESQSALDAILSKGELPWRHCHAPKGLTSDLARAWQVRALPEGFLIDHTGRVRYVRPWSEGTSWLEAAANELLERRDASEGK